MKKTQEIIGLPIIDLSSGNQVGKVWDIIINGDKGEVDYFIIDDGMIIIGAKVVKAKDIQGIGEYALTIANKDMLKEIVKEANAIELYKKNVRVKGNEVLTQKGRLVGKIGEIYIDKNDCSISAVEFMFFGMPNQSKLIRRDKILTFGEKLVVVVENMEDILEDIPREVIYNDKLEKEEQNKNQEPVIGQVSFFKKDEKEHTVKSIKKSKQAKTLKNKKAKENNKKIEEAIVDDIIIEVEEEDKIKKAQVINDKKTKKIDNTSTEKPDEKQEEKEIKTDTFKEGIEARICSENKEKKNVKNDKFKIYQKPKNAKPLNLFEEKQKEYLVGRKATKVVKDKQGEIILNKGDIITRQAVDIANDEGKLIEIIMNNEANSI